MSHNNEAALLEEWRPLAAKHTAGTLTRAEEMRLSHLCEVLTLDDVLPDDEPPRGRWEGALGLLVCVASGLSVTAACMLLVALVGVL